MSNDDSLISSLAPFGIATLALAVAPRSITETTFPWMAAGLAVVTTLMTLHCGKEGNAKGLLGATIGAFAMCSAYTNLAGEGFAVPLETFSMLFPFVVALSVGFPLGVLIRVYMGEGDLELRSLLAFGAAGCVYVPIALLVYTYLGIPDWLINPYNPTFELGSLLHLGKSAVIFDFAGVCIASGIALLVLSWPLAIALGAAAHVTSRS